MIETMHLDDVAVLTMRHGKVNALDTELCYGLGGAVDEAAAAGARAIVLTGTGTVFSAGVDLRRVAAGRAAYLDSFLPALRWMFEHVAACELPVVAAVNGHAIAGGFVLAAAADWIVMAEGPGRVGVTELLVGVPFPGIAMELLRLRAGHVLARPLAFTGETVEAGVALARHLVDEVVPASRLTEHAVTAARKLAGLGPAFGITKRQLRSQSSAPALAVFDPEVDAIWKAPETLDRISGYLAALGRREG